MRIATLTLLGLTLGQVAWGQVTSGPNAGDAVAPCKVLALEGQEFKEVDVAKDRADKPTIFVFVQAESFDRPAFRFVKTLDGAVKKLSEEARIVAIWLTDDNDKTRDYLPKIEKYFEETTLGYYPGGKQGPENWNVNGDARVTAVVVNKKKVAGSFGYVSLNDTDVPEVEKKLKEALDKK